MTRMIGFRVRQWHKWLSLFIGGQVMIWLASGLYMVIMDLDFIHGDHLVRERSDTFMSGYSPEIGFADILSNYPGADEIVLTNWIGKPVYRIYTSEGWLLVDAQDGTERSPLGKADAIAVAQYHYARSANVASATLIETEADAPTELQSRKLPLWRIDFDDAGASSFYVSPHDGTLVARRHTYWRIFDFAWMLHIMDYDERANVNNTLLRIAAGLGLTLSIIGMWLLWFSFNRRKRINGE